MWPSGQLKTGHDVIAVSLIVCSLRRQTARAYVTGTSYRSGMFRIPLLFPRLRRFVYFVQRAAGRTTATQLQFTIALY